MTTSKWGDEHLFFKHTLYAKDLELRPEWEPYVFNATRFFDNGEGYPYKADEYDIDEQALMADLDGQMATASLCPFSALFDFLN